MSRIKAGILKRLCLSVCLVWVAMMPLGGVAAQTGLARAAAPVRDPLPDGAPPRTGIILPLYIYPGPDWDRLIQVKNSNSRVPMVAVINPFNGPGGFQDANYVSGIQNLRAAGIVVLGYVYTSYTARSLAAVEADIDAYRAWYPLDGIFLDQMSDLAGYENYYSTLNAYAKSLGFTFTMGNPATDTLPSYIGTVDNMIIYENAGLPGLAMLAGWHSGYPKQNFSMLAYGVPGLDQAFVGGASDYVGYLYLTDDVRPNPYDALPAYFEQLVSVLNNKPPRANNAFAVPAGTTLSVAAPGILEHDSDADGDPLTAALVSGPSHGVLTLNPDGSFNYAPETGFTGIDVFTYRAQDAFGGVSGIATVTIQVVAP